MVSADNLNLDVLELIFTYLSRDDLAAVALVSRSFLSGVIPRLYRQLFFRLRDAIKYPSITSPFAAILAHPQLAIHVRHVDIRTVPVIDSRFHPKFIRDCSQALALCSSLHSFTCTVNTLPSLIFSPTTSVNLRDLRINANLTTDQANRFLSLTHLRHLTLDFASWNVMDILPQWTGLPQNTLTSLALFMCDDLNEIVLESALTQLPNLTGLHVISCPKIDHVVVLRLIVHTPLLESLSFTATDTLRPLEGLAPPLRHLRNLAIEARHAPTVSVLETVFVQLQPSSHSLVSFRLKFSERHIIVEHRFLQLFIAAHALTLKSFVFVNCTIDLESLGSICQKCIKLERLEMALPVKEISSLTSSLRRSASLRTIVDLGDSHSSHGPRPSLTQKHVRDMMRRVHGLRTIVSDSRLWTRDGGSGHDLRVSLERRRSHAATSHWFMPRDA